MPLIISTFCWIGRFAYLFRIFPSISFLLSSSSSSSSFLSPPDIEAGKVPFVRGIFDAFQRKNQRSRDEIESLRCRHEPDPYRTSFRFLLLDRCSFVFPNPPPLSFFSKRSRSIFRGRKRRGRGRKERGGNECEIIARNNGTKHARCGAQRWAKPRDTVTRRQMYTSGSCESRGVVRPYGCTRRLPIKA